MLGAADLPLSDEVSLLASVFSAAGETVSVVATVPTVVVAVRLGIGARAVDLTFELTGDYPDKESIS
jgi:hypothetical protein